MLYDTPVDVLHVARPHRRHRLATSFTATTITIIMSSRSP